MANLLTDHTAIVTGAASGIGRAISLTFAEHGSNVVVADIKSEPRQGGEPTHAKINRETDAKATFVECDVTKEADLRDAIGAAEEMGDLSILVNNAGIYRTTNLQETTEEEYDQLMDINAKAVFFASQIVSERLVDNGGGCIINMSSLAGYLGNKQYPVYTMSKAAIRMLTYSLADELGPHGIRVNTLHPGSIDTALTNQDTEDMDAEAAEQFKQMIPLQRTGSPEDVAGAALFLASDLASYVTGESLLVDGGYANTG
ncbi:3-ketoacyl-ACP reductase [Halorubrum sp. C3]|nr:3-ketoacyl-ACP reductase [Halorubrum sp. C3]